VIDVIIRMSYSLALVGRPTRLPQTRSEQRRDMHTDPPSLKPLRARLSGTPGDRRMNRLKPPPCPSCGHDDSRVASRTDYVLYFRCADCANTWSAPKPGIERFGT